MGRYFKFVGTLAEGREYPVSIEPNEIFSEDFRMYVSHLNTFFTVGKYADNNESLWSHEWEEVLPQKTFPPDPITLDTYETGEWYDVREVLPDESFHRELVTVKYLDGVVSTIFWDELLNGFASLGAELLIDDVKEWMVYES